MFPLRVQWTILLKENPYFNNVCWEITCVKFWQGKRVFLSRPARISYHISRTPGQVLISGMIIPNNVYIQKKYNISTYFSELVLIKFQITRWAIISTSISRG
jgi:hypothetical protein